MKKGEIYEGIVKKVDFPNKSKVELTDGSVVTVKNGIPGQKLSIQINKIKHGKPEARVLEILEKSPIEKAVPCKHADICGGCTYQTVLYEEQLKIKETQIKELLDSVIDYDYEYEGIKGSPRTEGYRNKMEFSFGDEIKDGPLALGMHKRGSFYDIVTVDSCKIADSDYNKILTCVLEHCKSHELPFYKKMQHEGFLRHLLVRKAIKTEDILIDIVTSTQMNYSFDELVEELKALDLKGTIAGILHTYNDSLADVVQNDKTEILYGQDYFYESLLGMLFKITPFSFFQTNSLGAEVLYKVAREYVGETDNKVVFDLYSGTGTIAQVLAPVAKKVVGVEIIEEAVKAAKVNAQMNNLSNCEFIAGDVLKVIDELEDKPDIIVLDPPRDGIHPKALPKILNYGVDKMVYISCKPTSLVRDLVTIQEAGYRVVKAAAVDMFPMTPNVETVVLLSQRKADDYI